MIWRFTEVLGAVTAPYKDVVDANEKQLHRTSLASEVVKDESQPTGETGSAQIRDLGKIMMVAGSIVAIPAGIAELTGVLESNKMSAMGATVVLVGAAVLLRGKME